MVQEWNSGNKRGQLMGNFKLEQYKSGIKDFWLYLILTVLLIGIECFISKINFGVIFLETFLLFLLYQGYVWVWYFDVVRTAYNSIETILIVINTISNLDWMKEVYPPLKLIASGLGYLIIVAMFFFLLLRKNLKYFVKINQLKRKGKLDVEIL